MDEPNYVRAEAKSLAVLRRFCIEEPNFDIFVLAEALEIDVVVGGVSTGDARIVRTESGRGIIRLNRAITEPFRQRFSIAHEIGHWEMHPHISQGYLCTAANLRDYGESPEEAEANWFAATLLMPKFLLPAAGFREDPSFAVLSKLAREFGTSLTAAARRFVQLSKQPVVLVASSQRRVSWIARSDFAKYYFVRPGTMVPEDTVTADVIKAKATDCRAEKLSPSSWFPELEFDRDAELFEEVKYSPAYDGALTLLWIPA